VSTTIAANDGNSVVLATDSRVMFPAGPTDDNRKLFEIAPGVFYAANGWTDLAAQHTDVAARVARTADLSNPERFADELDHASHSAMERKAADIIEYRSLPYREAEAAGTKPFYGYALAFVSNGRPGYIVRQFTIKNSQVVIDNECCCFHLPPRSLSCFAAGAYTLEQLQKDPLTWKFGPVLGAEILIEGLKATSPFVGGPIQMVQISRAGSQWIHELPRSQERQIETPTIQVDSTGNGMERNDDRL
jgi:hypothetical protein